MITRQENISHPMLICSLDYLPEKEVFQKTDIPDHIFNLATNVPWNKMFLRSFIIENHLEFQEIRQANDTFFTLSAFYFAKRISYVTDVLISYRVNNEQSLSGKASDTVFCAYDSYCKIKGIVRKTGRIMSWSGEVF